jgi:hypothetical protein
VVDIVQFEPVIFGAVLGSGVLSCDWVGSGVGEMVAVLKGDGSSEAASVEPPGERVGVQVAGKVNGSRRGASCVDKFCGGDEVQLETKMSHATGRISLIFIRKPQAWD